MKNKIFSKFSLLVLILCLVFALSGCGAKEDSSDKGSDNNNESSSQEANNSTKDDLKVFDYIDKIEPENTVEEINAIVGFDGELTDEKYNKYSWKITEDTTLTATYYSSKTATISIDIDDDLLKDNKTDLSNSSDLKSEINSANGLKYDDFVSKFGTNGYMVEKSSSSTAYRWVNSKGGYIKANFSKSSGKCTFFSGLV